MNERIKVKRVPKRGHYDKETIYGILDKEFMCHIGFVHEGYPVVIPTLYGRAGNELYVHGSMASRMMNNLKEGLQISLTVTLVNGLVLARSAFHHSVNYESVVVFGNATLIEEKEEKMHALKCVSDQVIPKRWEEVREPNNKELKGTMVLKISLDTASAKVRTGGPVDEKDDYNLNVWAGELPIIKKYGEPVSDELLASHIGIDQSVLDLPKTN